MASWAVGGPSELPSPTSLDGLLLVGVAACRREVARLSKNRVERVTLELKSGDPDDVLIAAEQVATRLGVTDGAGFWRRLEAPISGLQPTRLALLTARPQAGRPEGLEPIA
ncbi:MAG: hypothetical protein ABIO70_09685 [Pseudomonadota bacterium]